MVENIAAQLTNIGSLCYQLRSGLNIKDKSWSIENFIAYLVVPLQFRVGGVQEYFQTFQKLLDAVSGIPVIILSGDQHQVVDQLVQICGHLVNNCCNFVLIAVAVHRPGEVDDGSRRAVHSLDVIMSLIKIFIPLSPSQTKKKVLSLKINVNNFVLD